MASPLTIRSDSSRGARAAAGAWPGVPTDGDDVGSEVLDEELTAADGRSATLLFA